MVRLVLKYGFVEMKYLVQSKDQKLTEEITEKKDQRRTIINNSNPAGRRMSNYVNA